MKKNEHAITGGFVFLLLGVFAVMSAVLVLFGVQAYRGNTDAGDRHNSYRILTSYVRSMVRTMDAEGIIGTENVDGTDTLFFLEEYDGEEFITRIYTYEGKLREWFSEAAREFEPALGEEIFDAEGFSAQMEDHLLTVRMRAPGEQEDTAVQIALRCDGKGADRR